MVGDVINTVEVQAGGDENILFCKRNELEWLKFEAQWIYHSLDGGRTWVLIPAERTLWAHIVLAPSEWPPIPQAFGWRNGVITIAHSDLHEDGSPNFRYLSSFNDLKRKWTSKSFGRSRNYFEPWWMTVDFEIQTAVP